MSGIFLHRFWKTQAGRPELHRSNIAVQSVLTNELAVEKCVRYIDVDLNRSYKDEYYHLKLDESGECVEESDEEGVKLPHEAKVVAKMMAQLGNGKTDIEFDLHNTTATTGVMLLIR